MDVGERELALNYATSPPMVWVGGKLVLFSGRFSFRGRSAESTAASRLPLAVQRSLAVGDPVRAPVAIPRKSMRTLFYSAHGRMFEREHRNQSGGRPDIADGQ